MVRGAIDMENYYKSHDGRDQAAVEFKVSLKGKKHIVEQLK
jgi:hypothetical protein